MPQKLENIRRIGISLGDTENLRDGLGEFSVQLGKRIAAKAPELREKYGIEIVFHVRRPLFGIFGDQFTYLRVSRSHRWYHKQDVKFDIWHNLHQLNRTCPPSKCRHRLATVHDLNFLYFKTGYSRFRDTWRMKLTLSRMNQLIAISDYVRKDFMEKMNWNKPIEVIYNGARNLTNHPKKKIENQIDGPFIFHLSRMAKSKNVDSIIELARIWPEMNFVFSGPSSEDTIDVAAKIQSFNLKNIHLVTDISDEQKSWLFENCSAFLFPSLTEGFGLPPIEAMNFGKPVFLSNLTSLPEIGGKYAIYFDEFSPKNMKEKIIQGIPLLEGMKKEIKEHAQQFDWDKCANRYLELYLHLLQIDNIKLQN